MASWWDAITGFFDHSSQIGKYIDALDHAASAQELETIYKAMPAEYQNDQRIKEFMAGQREKQKYLAADVKNPLAGVIQGMLDSWVAKVETLDMKDPAKAKATLSALTADVMTISGGALLTELALGALPNDEGTVASNRVSTLMAWLGFGAVVTAVAHDPVKIGLLRPYQDSLEATFRNRRPGDFELFQAYRTRELTASKPTLEELADDKVIDRIEVENDKFYQAEIAKWGYSEWFAGALARSATTTLTFGNLTTLARAGALSRGLAAYSLWGQGLDRVLIKPALEALDKIQQTEQYAGFRSLIEPSYVDGLLTEAELQEYWTKAAIPAQVQEWVLPRLKKRREDALVREKSAASQKERDLTVSQVTQAYQGALIKRTDANNMITALGYSQKESDILLDLAETRIKAQGSAALKRLSLTDYEKAYKAGLIKIEQVLDRMKGEYAAYDIELERQLLVVGKA